MTLRSGETPTRETDAAQSVTRQARYWDLLAEEYQRLTRISTSDFHYGPLLPGDRELGLLPTELDGCRCLELGAGAGQNSICLARRGADCLAVDLSARQLAFGRDLVREHGVNVAFLQADLQGLPLAPGAAFDLIHSSFALPFLPNPVAALSQALRHLKPGGHLVLATIHPLATAEWLTVDEDEDGIFLPDYYHPPVDTRHDDADDAVAVCRPLPVSTVFGLLRAQELEVEALLEPPALPVDQMAETEIRERVPYESEAWRELAARFRRVPFALVIRARKPDRVRA